MNTPRHIPLFNFETVDDLLKHLPDSCPLVGVEMMEGAAPLVNFKHPERCCYLLGAEDHGLNANELAQCHSMVVLPGRFSMNVAIAGSIVLWERWRQNDAHHPQPHK